MKIALLFPNNIYTSPYLDYFTQILEKQEVEYDFINWDREMRSEENTISFRKSVNGQSTISKIWSYYSFRKFLIRRLSNGGYSKVIVFSCQLGILLADFLTRKFRNKYLLDIRDHSVAVPWFKKRFQALVENAELTTISSPGFKEWLPAGGNFVVSHNVNIKLVRQFLESDISTKEFFRSETVKVTTIGQIKDYESDRKFVSQLAGKENFNVHFIGFGPALDGLKHFVNGLEVSNVHFKGPYKKEEERSLLADTDFINILISRSEINKGSSLLSNRLYLSALYRIPCIVNAGTEQSRIIEKYKFGIVVDHYEDLPELLTEYKADFKPEIFDQNCRTFLESVQQDYEDFTAKTTNFITEKPTYVQG